MGMSPLERYEHNRGASFTTDAERAADNNRNYQWGGGSNTDFGPSTRRSRVTVDPYENTDLGASVLKNGELTMIDGSNDGYLTTALINHFMDSLCVQHEVCMFAENTAIRCGFTTMENGVHLYYMRVLGVLIFEAAMPSTIREKIYSLDRKGWDIDPYEEFNKDRKYSRTFKKYMEGRQRKYEAAERLRYAGQ